MRVHLAIILLSLLAACAAQQHAPLAQESTPHPDAQTMQPFTKEQVTLTTEDGVSLAGSYYDAAGERSVILLHQFNLDRESWDAFAKTLQQQGFAVLAIDLRGHGASQGDRKSFTEQDFQKMLNDAEAASTLLQAKKKHVNAILGASIGANTALRYSSVHKTPAVLLSPGLDYKGIDINNVTSNASTLIIVAQDDAYSAASSRELDKNNMFGEHALKVVPGSKHGTYLLTEPGVEDAIVEFLERYS
jgi:dienelactone hydrolase